MKKTFLGKRFCLKVLTVLLFSLALPATLIAEGTKGIVFNINIEEQPEYVAIKVVELSGLLIGKTYMIQGVLGAGERLQMGYRIYKGKEGQTYKYLVHANDKGEIVPFETYGELARAGYVEGNPMRDPKPLCYFPLEFSANDQSTDNITNCSCLPVSTIKEITNIVTKASNRIDAFSSADRRAQMTSKKTNGRIPRPEYVHFQSVRARHVLVSVARDAPNKIRDEKFVKAQRIRQSLLDGEDFAEMCLGTPFTFTVLEWYLPSLRFKKWGQICS